MIQWIKRRRGVRRGPWRSEKYRRYIASLPCLICRKPGTQASHTVNNGMSSKGPDSSCIPLCPACHDRFDGRTKLPNGEIGRGAFVRFYGRDLQVCADLLFRTWSSEKERKAKA